MIKFTLNCTDGHRFDSWFASSSAFSELNTSNLIGCPHCGNTDITKSLMSPAISSDAAAPDLSTPSTPAETGMEKLRKSVEENADYVGLSFTKEARAISDGTAPERAIYGEASLKDAKALLDEGIPVAPIPFIPKQQVN